MGEGAKAPLVEDKRPPSERPREIHRELCLLRNYYKNIRVKYGMTTVLVLADVFIIFLLLCYHFPSIWASSLRAGKVNTD